MTERLNKTVQNELMNIVTIFLGVTVGATATASTFLTVRTLEIIAMGIVAFGMGTAGGVLLAKLMNKLSGGKINPLIGSAGVSAVPMAARVVPEGRSEGESRELPADARHGPERCWRYRLCHRGWCAAEHVRLIDTIPALYAICLRLFDSGVH